MRVLITGGRGFIGKHLINRLLDIPDIDLHSFVREPNGKTRYNEYICDITDTDRVRELVQKIQPEIVFHLAGNPLTKLDDNNPNQILLDNIVGTQNIIHFLPSNCRVVFASSIVVYGDCMSRMREELPCNPTSVYGVTKLASEHLINSYTKMGRIKGLNLRLCATVGAGLTHGILKDFIVKASNNDQYFNILGNCPGTCKPYLHINDAVSAFILFGFEKTKLTGPVNITPNDEITANSVANIVLDTLLEVKKIEYRKAINFLGNDTLWKGDNSLLQSNSRFAESHGWSRIYNTSSDAIKRAVLDNI